MNQASEMSKMIRAKKKSMLEEKEDPTDEFIEEQQEDGVKAQSTEEQKSPEDETMSVELEQLKKLKRDRISKTMSKMGR